jgi:hypothetical protein
VLAAAAETADEAEFSNCPADLWKRLIELAWIVEQRHVGFGLAFDRRDTDASERVAELSVERTDSVNAIAAAEYDRLCRSDIEAGDPIEPYEEGGLGDLRAGLADCHQRTWC